MMSKPKQAGFTLIELLVVVVIIGILASVAIPNFVGAQDKAKNSGVQSNGHQVQMAIEQFAVDNAGQYPGNISAIVTQTRYINGFPKTPWNLTQSSGNANIALPTVALNQVIAAGTMAIPTSNTHYGAIEYTMSGSANERYQLMGSGKSGANAMLVFSVQNF